MVAVMTLTGAVVVDHHHHGASNVFPIIGAHVIGMFGLIIVVGDVVDQFGRTRTLAGGLLLGASPISLLWITSVPTTMAALFGLGLGWNFSYVAATAGLSDSAAAHSAASCWASTTSSRASPAQASRCSGASC